MGIYVKTKYNLNDQLTSPRPISSNAERGGFNRVNIL